MLMHPYILKCMFQALKKIPIENGNLAKILPIEWQSGPQSYALMHCSFRMHLLDVPMVLSSLYSVSCPVLHY